MIQLSRRTVTIAAAAIVAALVLAASSVVLTLTRTADASHKFNDVGTGTFFHNSTAWLADNGIADGYSDGTFRTGAGITRGQASYWFSNYNNSLELVSSSDTDPVTTDIAHGASCAPGKRAVAGGGQTNAPNLHLTDSYPHLGGWVVRFEYAGTVTPITVTVTAWALCAPETIP